MSRDNFWPVMGGVAAFVTLALGVTFSLVPRSEPQLGSGSVVNTQRLEWQTQQAAKQKRAEADEANTSFQKVYDNEMSGGGVVWNKYVRHCYFVVRVRTYYNYHHVISHAEVPCCQYVSELAPAVRHEACPSDGSGTTTNQ